MSGGHEPPLRPLVFVEKLALQYRPGVLPDYLRWHSGYPDEWLDPVTPAPPGPADGKGRIPEEGLLER